MEEPGADSGEKHEPASDVDAVTVDSLKVLDPERPIREADCQGELVGLIGGHKKVPYLSVGISMTMILPEPITTGGSDECGGPQGGS